MIENNSLEKLRYPIGQFSKPEVISDELLSDSIQTIADFPNKLRKETQHLTEEQLDTAYRDGGWTIRQVIHHCADSHMNCLIRIKWALTEDKPIIKYYFEDRWAKGLDNTSMPISPSLQLLAGLHFRLEFLMKSLFPEELKKTYIHPEHDKEFALEEVICLYAWHCNHHLAHITALKLRRNWL